MRFDNLKQDKGVAGLTVLLALITMLFVIGLLVMIFALMGGEIQETSYETSAVQTVANESLTTVDETGENVSVASYRDVACTVSICINQTSNTVIPATNWTSTAEPSGCFINYTGGAMGDFNGSNWNCTYTYTWSANSSATDVMFETVEAIGGTTDWYDIFIVIGAMVVLILLTVIIITAIRGSGLMAGGGSGRGGTSGSA